MAATSGASSGGPRGVMGRTIEKSSTGSVSSSAPTNSSRLPSTSAASSGITEAESAAPPSGVAV